MKNLLKLSALFIGFGLFFTACEDDGLGPGPGPGTDPDAPEIAFVEATGFVSSSATVGVCEIFNVRLTAAKGAEDLNGVIFTEDGANLPDAATRITIDGAAVSDNTVVTLDTEKSSFTWDVAIKAHADVSTKTYGFIIIDDAQERQTIEVSITTEQNVVVPMINLAGSSDRTASPGQKTCFKMEVQAGSPELDEIAVFGYDTAGELFFVNPDRLCFGPSTQEVVFEANPLALVGDDRAGFEKNVCIRAQSGQTLESYDIVLLDAATNPYLTTISIDTRVQGMAVTTLEGVLLNSDGPVGQGGCDLSTGFSVGSNDAVADVKDEGIDISRPNADNWRQQISGANGTALKQLIPNQNGLSENFTFESVTTDLQIQEIWDNGVSFTAMNDDNELISDIVEVGDLFIANNAADFYLIVVRQVNKTDTDNMDGYLLDISF